MAGSYTSIYNHTLQIIAVTGKDGKITYVTAGATARASAAAEADAGEEAGTAEGADAEAPSKTTYSVVFPMNITQLR